eukprot:2890011-Prymnesium_polylepis.1
MPHVFSRGRGVANVDARPRRSRTVASSSTDAMSEASARRLRATDAPRFNGSVLPASVEQSRHGSPANASHTRAFAPTYEALGRTWYVREDLLAELAARVAHALHIFTARVASEPGGR